MKYVIVTDAKGYKRRYLVRDEDGDENAERFGIPSGPPNLDDLDLESIKKEINNALVDQGLFSWADINKSTVGLSVINTVFRRYVAALLKEGQAIAKAQARTGNTK